LRDIRYPCVRVQCGALAGVLAAAVAVAAFAGEPPVPELAPVVVSAERVVRPLGGLPSSVVVIDRSTIDGIAAQRLDDVLRSVPGFNLFRRQSSLVANPTTQGASLRGIGATGASRALVLIDGVPSQDAFGGWFAWGRVPLELVERIEVVRGGGSSLWGSGALSGVINIVTRAPQAGQGIVRAEMGNRQTRRITAVKDGERNNVRAQVDASYDVTEGYYLVSGGERVVFDTRADSRDLNVGVRSDWDLSDSVTATLRLRYFDERRDNGTAETANDSEMLSLQTGLEGVTRGGDGFRADLFGQVQDYSITFSSQDRGAGIEIPALDQFEVPAASLGSSMRWWREDRPGRLWLAGVDYVLTAGTTHEDFRYVDGEFTRRRKAGGREHAFGLYGQRTRELHPRVELTAGLRVDYWRSENGRRKERTLDTAEELIDASLPDRDEVFVSPRLGVLVRASRHVIVRSAAYRGFRAPTLNELYRPFRVRNDITEANSDLDLERVTGTDLGVDWTFARGGLGVTAYWNRLDDPIINVTIGEGPGDVSPCGFVPSGGVCRQRRNLGHTRTLGLEVDATAELAPTLTLRGGYLFSDAELRSDGPDAALRGNDVPQVAKHQAVAALDWHPHHRLDVALEGRYVGPQYDDDLNTRRLEGYFVLNAVISFALDARWDLFVRAENVTGDRFEVAESADGLVTYGPAALVNLGVRYRARP
jgi:outer membrane receptor protein involved in Fe transport